MDKAVSLGVKVVRQSPRFREWVTFAMFADPYDNVAGLVASEIPSA